MFFTCDDRNFGWSGAVSRNGSGSTSTTYNKRIKKDSNRIKSPSNTTHQNDFMSKIIKNSNDGKSFVIIPTTKSGSINVDNYIANII